MSTRTFTLKQIDDACVSIGAWSPETRKHLAAALLAAKPDVQRKTALCDCPHGEGTGGHCERCGGSLTDYVPAAKPEAHGCIGNCNCAGSPCSWKCKPCTEAGCSIGPCSAAKPEAKTCEPWCTLGGTVDTRIPVPAASSSPEPTCGCATGLPTCDVCKADRAKAQRDAAQDSRPTEQRPNERTEDDDSSEVPMRDHEADGVRHGGGGVEPGARTGQRGVVEGDAGRESGVGHQQPRSTGGVQAGQALPDDVRGDRVAEEFAAARARVAPLVAKERESRNTEGLGAIRLGTPVQPDEKPAPVAGQPGVPECRQCTAPAVARSTQGWDAGNVYCETHRFNSDAPIVPVEPSRPVTGEAVDWSRFVPTEEIPYRDDAAPAVGDAVASTLRNGEGRVVRKEKCSVSLLATDGRGDEGCLWRSDRWRLIRHADGRWADGYGPDGPTAPPAPSRPGTGEACSVCGRLSGGCCSVLPIVPATVSRMETIGTAIAPPAPSKRPEAKRNTCLACNLAFDAEEELTACPNCYGPLVPEHAAPRNHPGPGKPRATVGDAIAMNTPPAPGKPACTCAPQGRGPLCSFCHGKAADQIVAAVRADKPTTCLVCFVSDGAHDQGTHRRLEGKETRKPDEAPLITTAHQMDRDYLRGEIAALESKLASQVDKTAKVLRERDDWMRAAERAQAKVTDIEQWADSRVAQERREAAAQLATRDAQIAGLEASAADLAKRAQEAEARESVAVIERDMAYRRFNRLTFEFDRARESWKAARKFLVEARLLAEGALKCAIEDYNEAVTGMMDACEDVNAANADKAAAVLEERRRVDGWWAWWNGFIIDSKMDHYCEFREGVTSGAPAPTGTP